MLVIRKEQSAILEAYMEKRFRKSMKEHVLRELPDETKNLSKEDLMQIIEEGIRRGKTYGLRSELELSLYIDLLFAHSRQFENAPNMQWAKRILLNKELEGEVKMDLIYQHLSADQAAKEASVQPS